MGTGVAEIRSQTKDWHCSTPQDLQILWLSFMWLQIGARLQHVGYMYF